MKKGFTLIELLVAIAIVGILSTALLAVLNPLEQIKKGRDAQRKQDLAQIQRPLEVYYNDKGVYPSSVPFGSEWKEEGVQYMAKVPQDPSYPTREYKYKTEDGGYRLFATLERCLDNQVIAGTVCNTTPPPQDNFSVVSPNLSVAPFGGGPAPAPTATSTPPTPTISARVSPSFRAYSQAIGRGARTLDVGKPSGTTQNDLLLAHIVTTAFSGSFAVITAPTGWTLIRTIDKISGTTFLRTTTYWKIAGASESSTYTWLFSQSIWGYGTILVYSGTSTFSPIDSEGGQPTSNTTSHSTPSVTTTINNTTLVTLFGIYSNGSLVTLTSPSDMTQRSYTNTGFTDVKASSADAPLSTAGATGSKTATSSITADGTAQIIVIK